MLKWIEASGKNEEAAIASALAQLGLERDDVSVEVLERAKSGFLGIGASPARVKVSYEAPDEPKVSVPPSAPKEVTPKKPVVEKAPVPEKPVKKVAEAPRKEAAPAAPKQEVSAPKAPEVAPMKEEEAGSVAATADVEECIRIFLQGLFSHMGVSATPVITVRPEGGYQVILEGERLGALIGHRGETLDAIQQLTNYAINRDRQKRVRVHIDVENYRQKREEALQRLAQKVAAKVVKYRRNITLEPMNAYERHVIHETLQEYPDVVTYSTGTEPNRRTVVAFTRGKHSY